MSELTPMLIALMAFGCVTAIANAVATAASTAFPPRASTAAPRSEAMSDDDTTSPVFELTPRSTWIGWDDGVTGASNTTSRAMARVRIVQVSDCGKLRQYMTSGVVFAGLS